jgi:hypothetical protein
MNKFQAYGLPTAAGDVYLDRGIRTRGARDPRFIPTGGVSGIARSATPGSAS